MYLGPMSEWNYTKCAKPFDKEEDAREYMRSRDLAGWVLKRDVGFTAVCPTYPEGYYPDATVVAEAENSKNELARAKRQLPISSSCC
jgi:hypothetical protein